MLRLDPQLNFLFDLDRGDYNVVIAALPFIVCQVRNIRRGHRRGLIWDSTFGSGDKRIENFPLLHFKRIYDERPEHPRIFFNLTNLSFWQDKIEVK